MGICQTEPSNINYFISKEPTYKKLSKERINSSPLENVQSIKDKSTDNFQFNNSKRNKHSNYKFKNIPPKEIMTSPQNEVRNIYRNEYNSDLSINTEFQKKYLTSKINPNSIKRINNPKHYTFRNEKISTSIKLTLTEDNNIRQISLDDNEKKFDNKDNISSSKGLKNKANTVSFEDNTKSDKNKKIINDEDDTYKIISSLNEQIKRNKIKKDNSLILSFDDDDNTKDEDIQLYYLNEFNFNSDNIYSTENDFDGIIQSPIYKNKINFINLLLILPERQWYKELIELSDSLKIKRVKQSLDAFALNEYLNKFIKIYNHFNHLVWAIAYFYSGSLLHNKITLFKKEKMNLPSHYSLEWIKGFEWKGLHIRVLTYEQSKKLMHEIKAIKYALFDYLHILKNNISNNIVNENLLSNELIFPFMSYANIGGIVVYVSVEIRKILCENNLLSSNINMKDETQLEKIRKSLIRQSLRFSIRYDNFDYTSGNFDDNISFDEKILNDEINLSNFSKNDLADTKILKNVTEKNLLKIFDEYNDKKEERKFKFILINIYSLLPDLFKQDDKTIYHKLDQLNCIDIKNEFEAPRFINLTKINNLNKNNEMSIISKLIRINATKENINVYQNRIDNVDYKIIYDNSNKGNKINEQVTKFFVQLPFIQNEELSRLLTTEYLNVGNLNSILNKYNTHNMEEIPDRNIIIYRTSFRAKIKYSLLNFNQEKLFPKSNDEYISYFKQICQEMSKNAHKIRNIDNLYDFCERYGVNKKFIPFFIEYIGDEYLRNLIQIYLYTYIIKKYYYYHEGQILLMKLAIFERCKDESIINSSKDNNTIEMQKQFITDIIKLILSPVELLKQADSKDFSKLFFQNISFFVFLKMLKIKNFDKYINFQSNLAQLGIKNILIEFNEISRKNPFLFIDTLEKMINFRMDPFIKYKASIDINNLNCLSKKHIVIFPPKTNSFIDISSITSYIFTDIANSKYPSNNSTINIDINKLLSKLDLEDFYPYLIFRSPIAYDVNNKLLLKSNQYYIYNAQIMKNYCDTLEQILDGVISHDGEKELILFKSYLYLLLNEIFCEDNLNEAKEILNKMKEHLKYQRTFSLTQYSILYLFEAIISIDDASYAEESFTKSLLLSLLNQGDIRSKESKIHQFLMFPLFRLSKITKRYNNHYLNEYLNELNLILDSRISAQTKIDNKNKKINLGYYSFPFGLSVLSPSDSRINKHYMNDINFKYFICKVIIDYFYSIDSLLFDEDIFSYFRINLQDESNNDKDDINDKFNIYKNNDKKDNESFKKINKYLSEYILDEMSYQKNAPSNIVISFGKNNLFQTAHDYSENINSPRIIYSLININIENIFSGYDYNYAIDENNKIYSWGLNSDGQCGISDNDFIQKPIEIAIPELEKDEIINNIICGNKSTYFLSNKNKVYLCGYNMLTKKNYYSPKRVKFSFEKELIVQIQLGEKFCLFLTKFGNVYSIGEEESFRLGLGDEDFDNNEEPKDKEEEMNEIEPKQVLNIMNIQLISCGYNHCFAVAKNNIIFCWGLNNRGQLGLNNIDEIQDSKENIIFIPRKLVLNQEINNIFCGKDFTVFHTEKEEILVCGNNQEYQLGIGKEVYSKFKEKNDCFKPKKVDQFYNLEILKVACGEDFCIAMVRDSNSKIVNIWSWGSNKEGQLGLGSNDENSRPKPVPSLLEYVNHIPKDITCGKNHCLVLLVKNGKMNINIKNIIDDMILKYNKF